MKCFYFLNKNNINCCRQYIKRDDNLDNSFHPVITDNKADDP